MSTVINNNDSGFGYFENVSSKRNTKVNDKMNKKNNHKSYKYYENEIKNSVNKTNDLNIVDSTFNMSSSNNEEYRCIENSIRLAIRNLNTRKSSFNYNYQNNIASVISNRRNEIINERNYGRTNVDLLDIRECLAFHFITINSTRPDYFVSNIKVGVLTAK